MNPADYKDDDVVRYAKKIAAIPYDESHDGTTWAEYRFAHTITRFAKRIAWLENEIDHMNDVIGATLTLRNTSTLDKAAYAKAMQAVSDAVRVYWDNSLDDDGTEP